MGKKIIKFGVIEIEKQKFHQYKRPISIKAIDINKILISNKTSFGEKGFKYFIGYKHAKKFDLYGYFFKHWVHIEKTSMKLNISFFKNDDELLKKYNKISKKFKNTIDKEFGSDPVYKEKYLKAKIKSYNRKINTNFHNNKIPKEGFQYICFSVILIDSAFRTGNNYYPQVFLEEWKYVVKERKMSKYIIDDVEISSDSDKENSDEETSDEGNPIFFYKLSKTQRKTAKITTWKIPKSFWRRGQSINNFCHAYVLSVC